MLKSGHSSLSSSVVVDKSQYIQQVHYHPKEQSTFSNSILHHHSFQEMPPTFNYSDTRISSMLSHPAIQNYCNQHMQDERGLALEKLESRKFHKMPPRLYEAAQKQFSLSDFQLLDTLGTGTFGRVQLTLPNSTKIGPNHSTLGKSTYYAMKVLKKSEVVRLKQVEHVISEKAILAYIYHPFIVNLFCTFQDSINLYMLLEYVPGGELFSHLRRAGRFSNDVARFYSAEIVTAISYLHSHAIIYRDLKPENLLLDAQGHIKITDFGFAKVVQDRTWTLCGTPEYLAPEIIQGKGHNSAVDWWALGILIFEMLCGYPPFFDDSAYGIYEKILAGRIAFPNFIQAVAKDLIRRLLAADRTRRLGNLRAGDSDVRAHLWFVGVDWDAVESRAIEAPIVPQLSGPGDTTYFEKYSEPCNMDLNPSDLEDPFQSLFQDF